MTAQATTSTGLDPVGARARGSRTPGTMLINGEWVEAAAGESLAVINPARGDKIAEVPRSRPMDVDHAVLAARHAFASWKLTLPRERGQMLLRIADLLDARCDDLARVIATETGNALRTQAVPEAKLAADIFRYFGGLASEIKGITVPLGDEQLSYTRREPIGVVGAIVPWNAPVLLSSLKIAPAICAGNTIVLKAAEDAPLGVLIVAEACAEFLPAGVVNVITGYGAECGEPLLRHPEISKLSFTGSTQVGKLVMQAASERVLPVSLELGGKSPSIVFPDATGDWVVDGVAAAMRFTRQGQSCTAGSRLFIHKSIFDSFLDRLAQKVSTLVIGDPLDPKTDMGAIINEKQYRRVCDYISEGMDTEGASLRIGGLDRALLPEKGYFVRPTIFTHNTNSWRLAREEIFGPVLVAVPWEDEDEVLRMANDSHYGLAAYVWTREIGKALSFAHRIEAGWVQVNQGVGQSLGQSYGGIKQSGIGREFSLEGMLDSFTQTKSVTVNLTH